MLRLDFTNFYSIFQSIFHPCLNEGIPIQSSSQKGDQCSHFLQCAHIEAVQIRRFSAHSRILSVYDMYWLAVWNWHRLTACWLIARSSATWNLNLLCLLSCIFIASAGLTNCVCSKGLNVFPTPKWTISKCLLSGKCSASMFWNRGISLAYAVFG